MASALDQLRQKVAQSDSDIATMRAAYQAATAKINAIDVKDPKAQEQIAAAVAEEKAVFATFQANWGPLGKEIPALYKQLPEDEKDQGLELLRRYITDSKALTAEANAFDDLVNTKKSEAEAAAANVNKEVEANAAKTPEQTAQQNKAYVAAGGVQDDKSNPPQPNSGAGTTVAADGSNALNTVTVTGKRLLGAKAGPRLRKNPLGNFSSYTYQITLYMITPDAYNAFVLSGRKDINAFQNALTAANQRIDEANANTIDNSNRAGGAGSTPKANLTGGGGTYVIAQSGGVGPGQKRAPTLDYDFYIDDLKITQAINAKSTLTNTNTTKLSFTVTEPYGFSFLSRLQDAAKELATLCKIKGYADLKNPTKQFFVLGIQFLGYDVNGKLINSKDIPGSEGDPTANSFGLYQRFYDIYITKLTWKIDGRNVVYSVEAANLTGSPFKTKRGLVPHSLTTIGKTVYEALMGSEVVGAGVTQNNSNPNADRMGQAAAGQYTGNKIGLIAALNSFEKNMVGNAIEIANEWDIKFIGDAETYIKDALMVTPNSLNKHRWGRNPSVTDTSKSSDVSGATTELPDPNSKMVQIQGGTMILQAINSIITQSTFMTEAMQLMYEENEELIIKPNKNDKLQLWYMVTAQIEVLGWDNKVGDFALKTTYIIETYDTPMVLSTTINNTTPYYGPHKRYKYWFTGENSEIIKYEQSLDNNYFINSLTAFGTNASQGGNADVVTKQGRPTNGIKQGAENQSLEPQNNYITNLIDPGSWSGVKLSIIGDPDYLMQTSSSSISQLYKKFNGSDGFTINPNGGQVYIEIDFREPKDYNNNTGLMNINENIIFWKYPDSIKDKIEGIAYMLYDVVSRFNKGKFEQDLTGTIGSFDSAKAANQAANPMSRDPAQRAAAAADAAAGNQSQAGTNRLNRSSNASVPTIADGTGVSPLTPSTALAAASNFLDPAQNAQLASINSVGSINNVLDPMQKLSQNQTITIPTLTGRTQDDDAGTPTIFGRG
jgi:hypothetical protein